MSYGKFEANRLDVNAFFGLVGDVDIDLIVLNSRIGIVRIQHGTRHHVPAVQVMRQLSYGLVYTTVGC